MKCTFAMEVYISTVWPSTLTCYAFYVGLGFPTILQRRRAERVAADVGESRRHMPGTRSRPAGTASLSESAAAAARRD